MGEYLDTVSALDAAFHMPTYARKPVCFVRGDGMRLIDDDGREYLDFVSGIGAVNLGHAHPAVTNAVCAQMAKVTHVSNLFHVEHRAELAAQLATLTGGDRKVFFCNSGAEASEGAIKLARLWGKRTKGKSCVAIVTALRSFHGRTLAALAATGQPSKQEAFEPLPAGFSHVPLNDIDALDAAIGDDTCAVFLEPVQGEGGVHIATGEYLRAVRDLCDERGILLLFDEVQCGVYRTGPFLASDRSGVRGDVVTLAKALANGLPIGAIVADERVADVFSPGDHGSTFAGGPVVCAAARATLDALEQMDAGGGAETTGAHLRAGLERLLVIGRGITELRGAGLMNAIDLDQPIAADVAAAALSAGFVINSIGPHTLRFLPPLVCGTEEVDALVAELDRLLQ